MTRDTTGGLSAGRIEEWAGEIRVNRIRLIAIVVFYARHLIDAYMARDAAGMGRYHVWVTLIVVAWSLMAVGLHFMLAARRVPPWLKFISLGVDLLMITLIGVAAGGPGRTPIVLLYFVIIASAPLRLSLPLVWFATLGAMACYAFLLAYYAWWLIGWDRYYATPELRIPRSTEAIFLLSLGAAGLMGGQLVRQVRRMLGGYPVTLDAARENHSVPQHVICHRCRKPLIIADGSPERLTCPNCLGVVRNPHPRGSGPQPDDRAMHVPLRVIPLEHEAAADLRGGARNVAVAGFVMLAGGIVSIYVPGLRGMGALLIPLGVLLLIAMAAFPKTLAPPRLRDDPPPMDPGGILNYEAPEYRREQVNVLPFVGGFFAALGMCAASIFLFANTFNDKTSGEKFRVATAVGFVLVGWCIAARAIGRRPGWSGFGRGTAVGLGLGMMAVGPCAFCYLAIPTQ